MKERSPHQQKGDENHKEIHDRDQVEVMVLFFGLAPLFEHVWILPCLN
jgi:hypothetical protein